MLCARNSNLLRRITTLLIICCSAVVVLSPNTAAALPGSGTQEDPYRIESLADFDEFAADPNYWSGFTRLETDVNLAGRTYSTAVIAPYPGTTAFTGIFDGNDHTITNLTINGGVNGYLGLFGRIYGGEVRNLKLEDGSVSGDYCVGGLVGGNGDWDHPGCAISNCYSTGDVNGTGWAIGGLVGYNLGTVSNCYSMDSVSGVWGVGGLVGANGTEGHGIPVVPGYIIDSYSTGSVTGSSYVGGLVGQSHYGDISISYSTGNVNGVYSVGGLVGENAVGMYDYGTVTNCYSTGDVNGVEYVGGLVGHGGPLSNSYSTGSVSGVEVVGGLVGDNIVCSPRGGCFPVPATGCFWDSETSGQATSATGTGKTTVEMKTKSTFTDAGWDFVEIWLINEGATYPVLRQEIRSDLNGDGGIDMLDFAVFADHWLDGTGD